MNVENTEYLDYMHARYYDPNLGRFLSVDPGSVKPTLPQSWNRYSYALNNPLGNTDRNGREIFEQVHRVVGPWYHTSIRIEPVDQARWANTEHFRNNVNQATGRHYATIGAGSVDGTLIAGTNRERDVDLSIKKESLKVDLGGRNENEVIRTLFALEGNYQNKLLYQAFPNGACTFNSNSFTAGLLMAAGLPRPTSSVNTPGFLYEYVGEQQFGVATLPGATHASDSSQQDMGDRIVTWLRLPAGACTSGPTCR